MEKPLSAGGASIVPDTPGQPKSWQPPGGEISFTVRSFVQIPADAYVIVCFRWKHINERPGGYITARPVHLDLTDGGRRLTVTVVVPPNLRDPPSRFSGEGEYAGLYLVPLADVRILVVGKDKDGNVVIAADVSHTIGITRPFVALLLAALTVLAAFGVLSLISHRRLKRLGLDGLDPIIRIIATSDGYASLSQLQMVLWTVVVAASAVYVMVLSGDLIEITVGHAGAARHFGLRDRRHADARQAHRAPRRLPRACRARSASRCGPTLIVNETNGAARHRRDARADAVLHADHRDLRGDARAQHLRHSGNPAGLPDPDGPEQRGLFRRQGGAAGRQYGGGESARNESAARRGRRAADAARLAGGMMPTSQARAI